MRLIFFTLLSAFWGLLNAQDKPRECIDKVKQIIASTEALSNDKSKEFTIRFTIDQFYLDGKVTHEDFFQSTSDEYFIFESQYANFYSNKSHSIAVLKDQRQIYISNYDQKAQKPSNSTQQIEAFEKFVSQAKCQTDAANHTLNITFHLNKNGQSKTNIQSIQYLIDQNKNMIVKVTTLYRNDYKLKKSIYSTQESNYQLKQAHDIFGKVYISQGKLLSKYQGYKIIDKRK